MSWPLALLLFAQAAELAEPVAAPVARDTWTAQAVPEPLSDEEACAMFQDRAQRLAPDLPKRTALGKYRLRSAVDCAAKLYRVEDEVTIAASAMEPGWQAIEQDRWTEEYCDNMVTLPLIWRGWSFVQEIAFQDGKKLQIRPKCQ